MFIIYLYFRYIPKPNLGFRTGNFQVNYIQIKIGLNIVSRKTWYFVIVVEYLIFGSGNYNKNTDSFTSKGFQYWRKVSYYFNQ